MKPLPDDLLKAMCQASYDEKGRPFIVLDGERYFMPVLLAGAIADTWLGILRGIAVKQSQRDKIKIGKGRPQVSGAPKIQLSEHPIITRQRSAVKIEEPKFDELIFTDDEYAHMMAELEDNE